MKVFSFSLQRFDNINSTATNKTITGTSEADSITNSGHAVSISVGEGDNTVNNSGNLVTIIGGTGNDSIKNSGNNVQIFGNGGTDKFYNLGSDATITGGAGIDSFLFDEGSITLENVGTQFGSANLVTISGDNSTSETPATTTTTTPATTTTTVPATNTTDTTPASGNMTVTNTTTINNTTNNYYFGFPLASNMFGFFGGQNNTIQNFKTGTGTDANVLAFGTSLTSINRTSSYMSFNAADGSTLRVNNSSSVNEAIQYTTDGKNISLAKVGYAEKNNSFTYEDGVNFYSGGSHTDVLNVTNYQSRNIWLDGSAGVGYSGINNINAAQSSGNNTLAGDSGNNQITAGKGNDSLWGGSGSSEDVLIGGSGQNMFWYGKGDGNDQVQKAKTQDTINLYDVTLADITSANFTGNAISVGFNTGFSLNVNVSSNLSSTFSLADGTNWQYNKSAGSWQSA